ncbi:anaerobic ribonucleoside-triphosphate reductase activating protein [Mogibacterium neglectum]|uniref:anaerobic ribonucleoside-triphosphate reductase activating protein n=1 Tax=Mogibacterium neglectum TaxID=114528 RepID=UPI00272D2570|nr:anaerobic ribonucleoside-triphosphate reductase activating protein [Mogibacterium neglectum]WLD76745.1 anaerobic ribonucleoside-triphosphate reductase activating protein [Mogibacterium neglectum]
MYYGEIKDCDIANGIGVRVSLFVSGCTNRCPGCFQPQTWDFNYGQEFTKETEDKIIEMLKPDYITGLTVLGGEPFEPENQVVLVPFLKRVKEIYPDKTIWSFSGFVFEDLMREGTHCHTEVTMDMLNMIDVLIDGRFEQELKNIQLRFRGSENQRLIDMNRTREEGRVVLWDE